MPMIHNYRMSWKNLTLSVLLTATLLPALPAAASDSSDRMDAVLELLSGKHVSGTAEQELSDAAIRAMVDAVKDPYTTYMSAAEMEQFQSGLTRNYIGIGVEIGRDDKGIYVGNVFTGSPAEAAGLMAGDFIIKVDGKDIAGQTTTQATALIKGEENTNVVLSVLRGKDMLELSVARKAIQLPILESAMMGGGVGYLKLYSFSEDADELFSKELLRMKSKEGFRSLVIDLRDNPGGILESAANIAARFIPEGTIIQTRTSSGPGEPVTVRQGEKVDVPVYVLVNEGSASASEVLAGALHDHGAAVVAGTRTFGKGSVQQLYRFKDGSYLKVTIEEYLTPNGNPVNKVGIQPDLVIDGDLVQLLSVLREAGVPEFRLELDRSSLKVNGMKTSDALPYFREGERVWVHSRALAAMIGAEATWLPELSAVRIKAPGTTDAPVFSELNGNAKFTDGRLFIDAASFQTFFPAFSIQSGSDGSPIELRAEKGLK